MNIKEFLEKLKAYTKYFDPEMMESYTQLMENQEKYIKNNFTETGLKILKVMQENQEKYLNIFSAKQIGELLFISPRSASGSMRKLISDGYVKKEKSSERVSYSLTDEGKKLQLDKD